jgi:electron transfer flavoprotein alpha subunit
MILVIAEQRDGKLNRASWESIAGAQQIGRASAEPIVVAIPGAGVDTVASELAAASVSEVVTLDSAVLSSYTADGFTAALQAAIAELSPSIVVLPHTYQTRDFAPKLAARLDRAIITDVTGVKSDSGQRPRPCGPWP